MISDWEWSVFALDLKKDDFNSSVLAAILSLEHQILVHQVQSKYRCQIINSANFNTVLDF